MSFRRKCKASFKIWLEHNGKPVLGAGGAEILRHVQEYKSLSKAAQELGMSYRYLWGYVKNMEKILGGRILETFKGGKSGGGGARLTELGACTLDEYERSEHRLNEALSDTRRSEAKGLKTIAGDRLKGKVMAVEKDGIAVKIKIEVNTPAFVTALISKEVGRNLDIEVGDMVEAAAKLTEVTRVKEKRA